MIRSSSLMTMSHYYQVSKVSLGIRGVGHVRYEVHTSFGLHCRNPISTCHFGKRATYFCKTLTTTQRGMSSIMPPCYQVCKVSLGIRGWVRYDMNFKVSPYHTCFGLHLRNPISIYHFHERATYLCHASRAIDNGLSKTLTTTQRGLSSIVSPYFQVRKVSLGIRGVGHVRYELQGFTLSYLVWSSFAESDIYLSLL